MFCQDIETRVPRQHYLTTDAMIRNAARAAGGGIVYVKPHPQQDSVTRARIDKLAATDPNIRVSDASVHDLIAAEATKNQRKNRCADEDKEHHGGRGHTGCAGRAEGIDS